MRLVSALCIVFLGTACSGSSSHMLVPHHVPRHLPRPVADLSGDSYSGSLDYTVNVVRVVGEALSLGGSGLDIGPGSGWAVSFSGDDGEVLFGVTVHDDRNSTSDIRAWFLRGGGYAAVFTERPLFVEGSAGLSFDFINSDDFSTYYNYYFGLYAKGAICLRHGPIVAKLGGWLTLARAKQWGADEVDLGLAAWFVSLGGTW